MRPRTTCAGAGKLLHVALALWAAAAVAQPGLDVTVLPAFDGNVKEGHWFAVTTIISNTGPRSPGSLEIISEGAGRLTTFSTPVDLPRGSQPAYTLYALNEGFSGGGKVNVRLRLPGRRPIDREAQIRSHNREDTIVALVGARPSSPIALAGLRLPAAPPQIRPTGQSPNEYASAMTMPAIGNVWLAVHNTEQISVAGGAGLPTRAQGYDSIDVVILQGFRPARVSPEEADALTRWVAAGGTLVVTAGGSAGVLKDSFVEKMLPVSVVGPGTVSGLDGVARRYGIPPPPGGTVLVARSVQRSGSVLASQEGVPLVVEGRHDLGRVFFLAFDTGRQPARGWAEGMTELWRDILTAGPTTWRLPENAWTTAGGAWGAVVPMPGMQPRGEGAQTLADAVHEIPQMEVPSFGLVGAFLVLYVLVLVPINYFVLKALDKREWSWVTTPLIVIVFSVGAYMIGRSVKGGKVLLTQAAIVQARPGSSTAVTNDYIGIFSPSRTRYRVTMRDRHATLTEAVANPGAATASRLFVLERDTLSVPRLHIDMWAMKVLHSQGLVDLGKGILAEARLTPDDTIEGRITNNTPFALERCAVIRGPASIVIGDVPSGDSASFTVLLSQLTQTASEGQGRRLLMGDAEGGSRDDIERKIKLETANALLDVGRQLRGRTPRGELLVVGWIAGARRDIVGLKPGSDDEAHAAVLALRIPIRAAGPEFHIPANLTTVVLRDAAQPRDVEYAQDGAIHLSGGWLEADVHLPISGRDIIADSMEVCLNRKGGGVRLSMWDATGSRWLPLSAVKEKSNSVPVPNPQRTLRLPQGAVRIRLEKTGGDNAAEIRGLGVKVSGRRG